MGFTVKRRVLRRGSEKGGFQKCLERPLAEYDPSGVRALLSRRCLESPGLAPKSPKTSPNLWVPRCGAILAALPQISVLCWRGKDLGHSDLDRFTPNKSSELNSLFFEGKERPEFRRKRDLYEPLLTAMAQVLPFLNSVSNSLNLAPCRTKNTTG